MLSTHTPVPNLSHIETNKTMRIPDFQVQTRKFIVILSFFLLYLPSKYLKELPWKNHSFYTC